MNICEEFDNPYHRLLGATMEVNKQCGNGMPVSQVESIANEYGVDLQELLVHLNLIGGYKVKGGNLECPGD